MGEVNAGLSTTQVVVKELKASASVQDQMQFLEEVQPYRSVYWSISKSVKTMKNKKKKTFLIVYMFVICLC